MRLYRYANGGILLMSQIIKHASRALDMAGEPWGFICFGFLDDSGVI